MPAGTAIATPIIPPNFTHNAISTPMLTASAISMSIRPSLLYLGDKRKRLPCPHVSGAREPFQRTARTSRFGASRPLPDDYSVEREDAGASEGRPTVGRGSRHVKRGPEGLARIWLGDKRLTTRLYAAYRGGPCAYLSAASVRFLTPSFEDRCRTWNLTVLSDRPSSAAIPSVPLMRVSSRSSTTTSGLCCCTNCRTSVPSVVQAATLMSGSPSSRARSPSSTIA